MAIKLADEGDWLDLLVASERIHDLLESIKVGPTNRQVCPLMAHGRHAHSHSTCNWDRGYSVRAISTVYSRHSKQFESCPQAVARAAKSSQRRSKQRGICRGGQLPPFEKSRVSPLDAYIAGRAHINVKLAGRHFPYHVILSHESKLRCRRKPALHAGLWDRTSMQGTHQIVQGSRPTSVTISIPLCSRLLTS